MTKPKTNVRVPRCRRNAGKPWTPKLNAAFTLDWGRLSERKMVEKYGRRSSAIYRHSEVLGLPPQQAMQGKATLGEAARRLEVSVDGLRAVVSACGPLALRSSFVKFPGKSAGGPRCVYIDFIAAETCLTQHDSRTTTLGFYARSRKRSRPATKEFLEHRGLYVATRPMRKVRYPYDLLDEVFSGTEGPWCTVWRAVLAAGELPVARWFVALAVHDFVFGDVASREWFETVATKTSRDVVMPLVKQLRGPSVVRAERKSDVSRRRNR